MLFDTSPTNIFFDVRFSLLIGACLAIFCVPKLRRIGLVGLSILFYLIFAGYTALMILGILATLTHFASRATKAIVAIAIGLNIASLFFWKFAVASPTDEASLFSAVIIPLGFSFFIFEFCHYLIEIWRGNLKPIGFLDFIGFVFFFPTLIAGPIKRWKDFGPQFQSLNSKDFKLYPIEGLKYFSFGVFYKFIGDALATLQVASFRSLDSHQGDAVLAFLSHIEFLGILSFRIFFDFAGYSYIAIGVARLIGFVVPMNFNAPYLARNLSDFWERWHISLSSWVRDYIYISLGGSRRGLTRQAVNLLIAMVLIGLWHGASLAFVVWGLWHGVGMVAYHVHKRFNRLNYAKIIPNSLVRRVGATVLTFSYVSIGWLPFFYSLPETIYFFRGLFGGF